VSDVGATLTELDLVWWGGRIEHWLRFGAPVDEQIIDRRRRTVYFGAGAIFAVVRWAAGDYGTVRSELDILRAASSGEAIVTRPGLRPGADLLAAVEGWTRVQRALAAIDAVEAAGFAPDRIAPDYWRHLGNRLAVGLLVRPYTRERHRAWRLRRQVAP
jgi:hypothetical protein